MSDHGGSGLNGSRRWLRPGDAVEELRWALLAGAVAAVPTESSYGLATDPRSAQGVDRIHRIKHRARSQPLPVVAADLSQIEVLGVRVCDPAITWARCRWPAALSVLVQPRRPLPAMCGADRLAVRIPGHADLRALLTALGFALTATSANRSQSSPILDPAELVPLISGEDVWVIDGGVLPGGLPSTMVGWREDQPQVLRKGRWSESVSE